MNQENKDLLEYALNEKEKYKEVYTYIDNVINPKENHFYNPEVFKKNVEQLYNRSRLLEMIIEKIAKEE